MANDDRCEFEGTFVRDAPSGKAFLINVNGKDTWIPKSQMTDVERQGEAMTFKIPEWLAIAKEFV